MKKIILILSIFFGVFMLNANAMEVLGEQNKGDYVHIGIKCDNGKLTDVSFYHSNRAYWGGGRQFSDLKSAAISACNHAYKQTKKDTNKINIVKGAILYKKRVKEYEGIEVFLLKNKSLSNSQVETSAALGNKNFLYTSKSMKANVLKYYPPRKVSTDKYGNYKSEHSNGKYTKILLEGYYKFKTGNSVYYVRKSDTF
jgi:hypothetical protein